VDDEPALRTSTAAILEDDYQVETAEDARQALVLLAKAPFDIVCTDLVMPGINGYELLRRVADLHGHTGRVLMTAYTEYLNDAPKDRKSFFLVIKPFDPAHLLNVLARAYTAARLRRSASDFTRLVKQKPKG
jgi:DNA-binding NtrC family response regulator